MKIYKTKNKAMGKIWQRNYYEHIIRNEKSYLEIAQYIFDNPAHWETDPENPSGQGSPLPKMVKLRNHDP
ncbi:MAG: transposase [Bellilinea sp.]